MPEAGPHHASPFASWGGTRNVRTGRRYDNLEPLAASGPALGPSGGHSPTPSRWRGSRATVPAGEGSSPATPSGDSPTPSRRVLPTGGVGSGPRASTSGPASPPWAHCQAAHTSTRCSRLPAEDDRCRPSWRGANVALGPPGRIGAGDTPGTGLIAPSSPWIRDRVGSRPRRTPEPPVAPHGATWCQIHTHASAATGPIRWGHRPDSVPLGPPLEATTSHTADARRHHDLLWRQNGATMRPWT